MQRELRSIARVGVNFQCCHPSFYLFIFSRVLNPTGLGQREACRVVGTNSTYRIEESRATGCESSEFSDKQVFGMLFR